MPNVVPNRTDSLNTRIKTKIPIFIHHFALTAKMFCTLKMHVKYTTASNQENKIIKITKKYTEVIVNI